MKKVDMRSPPSAPVQAARPDVRPVADPDEGEPSELEHRRLELERRRAMAEKHGVPGQRPPARRR